MQLELEKPLPLTANLDAIVSPLGSGHSSEMSIEGELCACKV